MAITDHHMSKTDMRRPAYYPPAAAGAKALRVHVVVFKRHTKTYRVRRCDPKLHVFNLVVGGRGSFVDEDDFRHELRTGSVYVYGPGRWHEIETRGSRGLTVWSIGFEGRKASGLMRKCCGGICRACPPLPVGPILRIIRAMEDAARVGGQNTAAIGTRYLEILLMAFADEQRRRHAVPDWVVEAAEYMDSNACRLQGVGELAELCAVSPEHLCRQFREAYGETPYQRLLRLKMSEAALLLAKRDLQLREVAVAVGYQDASTFSKAFKRVVGTSPRNFRQTLETRR